MPFFMRMIKEGIKRAIANGLPSAEDKSEVCNHPLITGH
jgi:hypothetical protein